MKPIFMESRRGRRVPAALLLTATLILMARPFAAAQTTYPAAPQNNPNLRSSGAKKLVLVGGAALLYYLYRRHQAAAAQTAQGAIPGRTSAPNYNAGGVSVGGRPQLYRSKNGGIYYRDAQKHPVWLTVPAQGVQVPADDLRQYAPDYNRYRGPAPAAPRGYTTQPFSKYDPSLMSATGVPAPPSRMSAPSGPVTPQR